MEPHFKPPDKVLGAGFALARAFHLETFTPFARSQRQGDASPNERRKQNSGEEPAGERRKKNQSEAVRKIAQTGDLHQNTSILGK